MRVEWNLDGFDMSIKNLKDHFAPIALKFKMDWHIKTSKDISNVAIFVSKQDHCLADLLHKYHQKELNCSIKIIISNHLEAKKLADFYHIPYYKIPINKNNKKVSEKKILIQLKKYNIDLIVLARFMQILSPDIVRHYPNNIINIHHSFLPSFIGAKPYHQAYKRGVKIIGATSHYVTVELDEGPIIEQDVMRISHRDEVDDLVSKGRDLEKTVLFRAIKWHTENKILIYSNKTVVFN